MDVELFRLYIDAHCGLVCPFPRLEAMRSRPDLIASNADEFHRLCAEEREYLRSRAEARAKFVEEYRRRHASCSPDPAEDPYYLGGCV